ncbi:MAG: hypothetical protein KIH69_005855 [Anaerolineae bacterium]|nr:hypothetical protein [Anaerolineae bacterium]
MSKLLAKCDQERPAIEWLSLPNPLHADAGLTALYILMQQPWQA